MVAIESLRLATVMEAPYVYNEMELTLAPDRISFMSPLIISPDEIAEATRCFRRALDDTWKDLQS